MIPCLCFVALLLIVLLIMDFENEYEIVYANQLRGIQNDVRNHAISSLINSAYDKLYSDVIEKATTGEHKHSFTLMCKAAIDSTNCLAYHGYKEWSNIHPQHAIALHTYNIEPYMLRKQILHNIEHAFPDSNITTAFVRCCHVHTISW